jgi:glycosyltransferase involved in cell wall biosynthesis
MIHCTFDGVANVYHGIGTQTRYLLSCLAEHRSEIEDAVGDFDVQLLVPDYQRDRPGYTLDQAVLNDSLARAERARVVVVELAHDDGPLFTIEKWHQVSRAAAEHIAGVVDSYDTVTIVAVDAIYCVLAEHLDEVLSPEAWKKTTLVSYLASSAKVPGTSHTPGREEAEAACVERANRDPRVFLADIGQWFSRHLVEAYALRPDRLKPYPVCMSFDDAEMQVRPEAEARAEVLSRGVPLDRPLVLSFGRADPIKGFDQAIAALRPLAEAVHFVLVAAPYNPGDPELERYRGLLEESGLRYSYFPQFERSLPISVCSLPETSVVLATPVGEPLGMAPQEVALWARACGPIIVGPNDGGLSEQIEHGVTGLVFEQGDVDSMTATVAAALSLDEERLREMRSAAYEKVLRERDLVRVVSEFLASVAGSPVERTSNA